MAEQQEQCYSDEHDFFLVVRMFPQERLGMDFEQVLYDNIWDLVVRTG